MKIVIRAGGLGKRLWPMSRKDRPKQFLKLISDKTLLHDTIERVAPNISPETDLFVSGRFDSREEILKVAPEVSGNNLILEPASRNTGPAICLECAFLEKRFGPETIVATLPSDDYISDSQAFRDLLRQAEEFLENNPEYILTPAVRPDEVDTGYSYLKEGRNLMKLGEEAIFEVSDWVEKPNADFCKQLIESGVYYYHTGMYIWQLGNIIKLWEEHNPAMLEACRNIISKNLPQNNDETIEVYNTLEKGTIESVLTHKISKIAMSVSNRIGWSDLGKWSKIKKYMQLDGAGNATRGRVLAHDTTDSLIIGSEEKLIAAIGLDNMIIVDTEKALFICPENRLDEIKNVVEEIEEKKMEDYL
ncbi:MAG: sugar phosphate nucleotidyltransferase [Patescibacteria group bacterium]|nr:sugar phosphate nucleotidyltransferase [Patescibacteria group bacterium]